MPDFSTRSLLPEAMDQEGASMEEIHLALHGINVINKWLGGYDVILQALNQLQWPARTITILDLGCGGGDTLRAIAIWAANRNKQVKLIGLDRNPIMTEYASARSLAFSNIEYITMSVFDPKLMDIYADITMNSLFCHHFTNDEMVNLLRIMHRLASHTVIINDIDRHWFAYYSIKILTALFSKSQMVKYDAPLSVARSLNRQEWENIMERSGIQNYSLTWKWAWRWQIIIPKYGDYAA